MVLTFVHMSQFDTRFQKGVNQVSIFEKMSQLGPFKKKILTPLTLFMTFTTKF